MLFRSPDPLERTTLAQLEAAARRAFAPKEEPAEEVDLFHVQPIRTSVREAIDAVMVVLPLEGAVSFRVIVAGIEDRMEIIVRFLAVLELFKQGMVDVTQVQTFGDLSVRRLATGERALDLTSVDDWEDEGPTAPIEASAAARATQPVEGDQGGAPVEAVEADAEDALEFGGAR